MGTNRRQGIFAFARQSAVGVPAVAPTWALPMSTGGGPKPVRDLADLPITRPSSARSGQYVQRARGEGTLAVLAHEEPFGELVNQVCGGTDDYAVVAGVPHHRWQVAEDLIETPLTAWVMLSGDWWLFSDTFVTLLNLGAVSGENVLVGLGLTAWHYKPHVEAPAFDLEPDVPRFKYIGSTIKVAPIGRTPGAALTNVESVELEIRRNPVWRYGPSLTPTMGVPIREIDLSASFTFDPDQEGWDFTTVSATGSLTGDEETQSLGQGSADVVFGRHPSDDARYVRIYTGPAKGATADAIGADTAPFSANWEFDAARPDPDPGGGPIDISAAGRLIDPPEDPGDSEVTIVLAGGKVGAY